MAIPRPMPAGYLDVLIEIGLEIIDNLPKGIPFTATSIYGKGVQEAIGSLSIQATLGIQMDAKLKTIAKPSFKILHAPNTVGNPAQIYIKL